MAPSPKIQILLVKVPVDESKKFMVSGAFATVADTPNNALTGVVTVSMPAVDVVLPAGLVTTAVYEPISLTATGAMVRVWVVFAGTILTPSFRHT
jgi:hypothetical protein